MTDRAKCFDEKTAEYYASGRRNIRFDGHDLPRFAILERIAVVGVCS